MQRIRTIAVFPTMFTLGNLFCGFFSIVVAARVDKPTSETVQEASATSAIGGPMKVVQEFRWSDDPTHNVMLSGWLIFLAMVFDALDGHVARLSRTSSEFGAQLDSLCDLVTFGVAPAFLLVKMCPQFTYFYPEEMWIIAASFPACTALRLARFNVETGEDDDHFSFNGLPCPAAAGSIAGFGILFYTLRLEAGRETRLAEYVVDTEWWLQRSLPIFALVVGALMVSRIPYPHVVNQFVRGHRSFGHIVGMLFALVAVMVFRGYAVPILCCAFVLGPPLRYLWQRVYKRTAEKEPLF